jgi:hypothetical protein
MNKTTTPSRSQFAVPRQICNLTIAKQESRFDEQELEIKNLTASLKEQTSLLQKVSAQMQVNRSLPQVVSNNR